MKKRAQPGKSILYDATLPRSLRQQWLLDYTVARYTSKNRSTSDNGKCIYSHSRHTGCAIGVHLPKSLRVRLDRPDKRASANVRAPSIWLRLPEMLQDLGQAFLARVQNLHDYSPNWNATGLSERGLIEAQEIANIYYLKNPTRQCHD